ncbi:hypothetical protein V8C26DRAFT_378633 [Trichoderma gracile]
MERAMPDNLILDRRRLDESSGMLGSAAGAQRRDQRADWRGEARCSSSTSDGGADGREMNLKVCKNRFSLFLCRYSNYSALRQGDCGKQLSGNPSSFVPAELYRWREEEEPSDEKSEEGRSTRSTRSSPRSELDCRTLLGADEEHEEPRNEGKEGRINGRREKKGKRKENETLPREEGPRRGSFRSKRPRARGRGERSSSEEGVRSLYWPHRSRMGRGKKSKTPRIQVSRQVLGHYSIATVPFETTNNCYLRTTTNCTEPN